MYKLVWKRGVPANTGLQKTRLMADLFFGKVKKSPLPGHICLSLIPLGGGAYHLQEQNDHLDELLAGVRRLGRLVEISPLMNRR